MSTSIPKCHQIFGCNLNVVSVTFSVTKKPSQNICEKVWWGRTFSWFNTQYPTDSYFVYELEMEYGWNFWLKISFSIIRNPTNFFFEIPPCAKKVIFITPFVFLDLNPHFCVLNELVWKRLCAWRNFKNIFSRPHFTIIFRPKILIFDTYSILST